MSWFTDRPRPAPGAASLPWRPGALAGLAGDLDLDLPPAPAPALAFDEGDLARVVAAAHRRGREAAMAELAADPAVRMSRALERLAAVLAEQAHAARADAAAEVRRTVTLAAAIARALPHTVGDPAALARRCADLLAGLDGPVRLVLPPAEAEQLSPLLPELARGAGLAGPLELEADALLPPGAARLTWPGGWLEQDPIAAAARVAALLDGHGAAPDHPPAVGADDADPD